MTKTRKRRAYSGLTKQVLATLLSCYPVWTSTPDLIALHGTGISLPRHRVWNSLLRLVRGGVVEREKRGGTTYWRTK